MSWKFTRKTQFLSLCDVKKKKIQFLKTWALRQPGPTGRLGCRLLAVPSPRADGARTADAADGRAECPGSTTWTPCTSLWDWAPERLLPFKADLEGQSTNNRPSESYYTKNRPLLGKPSPLAWVLHLFGRGRVSAGTQFAVETPSGTSRTNGSQCGKNFN